MRLLLISFVLVCALMAHIESAKKHDLDRELFLFLNRRKQMNEEKKWNEKLKEDRKKPNKIAKGTQKERRKWKKNAEKSSNNISYGALVPQVS